jgi:putative peptide zinc metalloprotease protein
MTQLLAESNVAVRRRADLRTVETRSRTGVAIVVKDPVAMKYHRLSDREFFVLEQLDGTVSLKELQRRYVQAFPGERVSRMELNRLLLRLHQCGLILSDSTEQGDRLLERYHLDQRRRWKQRLSGLLCIRFRGVDPEPVLRRVEPWIRPLISRWGMLAVLMLWVAAAMQVAAHSETLQIELRQIDRWLRPQALLLLAATIGFTKVLHELGHAVVCKRFGGECHQIGPLLIVFTPALYCDTSDSWMLPNRWHRAAVGLAGMATEAVIAALAVFVWAESSPGVIHTIALNLIIVCSVSTIAINANPLLRYDGYFVLADLCEMPNLGDESHRLLKRTVKKALFGIQDHAAEPLTFSTNAWLMTYGLLALIYRTALTILILWFLSRMLRPVGLESLGLLACGAVAIGIVVRHSSPWIRYFSDWRSPTKLQPRRVVRCGLALALLVGLLLIPLPSRVVARGRVVARNETPLVVRTSGFLKSLDRLPGQLVAKGDTLARLENRDVELQWLAARGKYDAQAHFVDAIRSMALNEPSAASELPAQQAVLEELKSQLQHRQRLRDSLTIHAPHAGLLIESPRRTLQQSEGQPLQGWQGSPTESANQACYLKAGEELLCVVQPEQWQAEVILEQSDVQRVREGARASVLLDAVPNQVYAGIVGQIARNQWNRTENADRRDESVNVSPESPLITSYSVHIDIDSTTNPTFAEIARTGLSTRVRIESEPLSIAGRVRRFLYGLFRFS